MSVEIRVEVTRDTASPALQRKLAAMAPHHLATKIAPPLARHWRDHLASLPKNKHGYPSTGFWEEAARSAVGIGTDVGALLSCPKLGVRQRLHGGRIEASRGENLTIPICAEAYGTTVADWGRDNLTLVILADGRKFLALWLGSEESQRVYHEAGLGKVAKRSEVTTRRAQRYGEMSRTQEKPKVIILRQSNGGADVARDEKHLNLKFLFRLKHDVDQEPNPDVIPSDLGDRAREEILKALSE